MAISQQDILNRIQQVYTEMGNTPEANAQIAKDAQQFGVTPEQIGAATNLTGTKVRQLASEAGQAFEPLQLSGDGMLSGVVLNTKPSGVYLGTPSAYDISQMLSTGSIDEPEAQRLLNLTVSDPVTVGMPEPEKPEPTAFQTLVQRSREGDTDAFSRLLAGASQTGMDLTGLRYPIEQLSTEAGQKLGVDPYNLLVRSTAGAKLYTDLLSAIEQGDTDRITNLQTILSQGPNAQLDYVNQTYGEGTAHRIAQEKLGFPFGIGPPGKFNNAGLNAVDKYVFDDFLGLTDDSGGLIGSVDQFFKDPIEALDRWKDMPSAQIAAAVAGAMLGSPGTALKSAGAAVSALNAARSLDSGKGLSTGNVLALALSAGTYLDWLGYGEAGTINTAAMENAGLNIQPSDVETTVAELETLASKGGEIYKAISEPVSTAVNFALDNTFGGANALIAKAGSYASDEFVQGMASGLTSAAISEITGEGNPAAKFFQELKGTEILEEFIPDLPSGTFKEYLQTASETVAGFEDWAKEQGIDPGVITRELAQAEDWMKEKGLDPSVITNELANLEDWAKENVDLSGVEDWIKSTGDQLAESAEPVKDALIDAGDAVADAVSGLDIPDFSMPGVVSMGELDGSAFTAKRGRQGALPVDTTFYYEEPSLALAILQGKA